MKRKPALLSIVLLLTVILAASSHAATYYIDSQSGSDSNAGTSPALAWRSLARTGYFNHSPGDQFLLKRGLVWNETLRISQSGTVDAPITFGAYGTGERPVLNAGGALVGLDLMNCRYIVLQDVRVTNSSLVGVRVVAETNRNGGDIIISNIESNGNVTGLQIVSLVESLKVHDVTVTDSLIHDNLYDGILVNCFAERIVLYGNMVYNNATDVDVNGNWPTAGIRLISMYDNWNDPAAMRDYIQDVVIENNEVFNNGLPTQNQQYLGWGIHADTVKNCVVRGNRVYDNGCVGLMLEDSEDCEISYNVIYDNDRDAQWSIGLAVMRENERNRIFNNTIYNCHIGLDVGCGASRADGVRDNLIANNVSVGNSLYNLRAVDGGENAGLGSGNVYTNNSFGPASAGFILWGWGRELGTYAALDIYYGGSTDSVDGDPMFVDEAARDFRLTDGSPCIDAGTELGATYDFLGAAVPQGGAPDVGACEAGVAAPAPEEPAPAPEEPAPAPEEPAPTPDEPEPTPEDPTPDTDEPAPPTKKIPPGQAKKKR